MRVCDFCKTSMYWDKESALRAGSKSMELPPSSRFKVGASGKIEGKTFAILGRLVYAHEKGSWSEWFIEMQDGSIKWLSEDEGELFLEEPLALKIPVPKYEELELGMHILLNDKQGVVEELGEARCIGGEGQIPFVVEIGEIYPYADGAGIDGSFSFGLEYDTEGEKPSAFIGKILSVKDSKASERAGFGPEGKTGEAIRCPSCGKPYEGPRVESTEMVVCESCGSTLELDEAEARAVGKNQGPRPHFTFSVGTPITLEGVKYEVMGRLYYVERDEGLEYPSAEYVLYEPDKGYLWLSEEEGNFTISRPLHTSVRIPTGLTPKMKTKVGQETFQVYDWGVVKLRWVDGALPWTAHVGETTRYRHLIKPPEYVDQEITGKEVELFRGRYVPREEMVEAAPSGTALPFPRGVYSCRPYVSPQWLKGLGLIGGIFLVLNVFWFFSSLIGETAKPVLQEKVTFEQYSKEHVTKTFEVPQDKCMLRLTGASPLRNSWLALDFALVNSKDQVTTEFWDEASYYQGRDSEGNWSEGSRNFTTYFMAEKAGPYRLLIHAKGGSGYRGKARGEPVTLKLEADVTISWYFILPMILAGLVCILGPLHRMSFEARRWSPVMEDDDDD
jgi:Domain of unknown function (DUF4178)